MRVCGCTKGLLSPTPLKNQTIASSASRMLWVQAPHWQTSSARVPAKSARNFPARLRAPSNQRSKCEVWCVCVAPLVPARTTTRCPRLTPEPTVHHMPPRPRRHQDRRPSRSLFHSLVERETRQVRHQAISQNTHARTHACTHTRALVSICCMYITSQGPS